MVIDLTLIYDLTFGGIVIGSLYALISVGMTLLFGAARMVNLAHGDFLTVGAYITYWFFILLSVEPLLSLILVAAIVGGVGAALYIGVFSRIYKRGISPGEVEIITLLLTFGLILIVTNLISFLYTPDFRSYAYLTKVVEFMGMSAKLGRLAVPLLALPLVGALYVVLQKSWFGKGIRCVIEDSVAAQLVGVNIGRVYLYCFVIGLATAGIAGTMYSINFVTSPYIGIEYTMAAFVVVILGSVGSIPGALIGGLLLGLIESTLVYVLAPVLKIAIIYSVLIAVLLIRPKGIFGKK